MVPAGEKHLSVLATQEPVDVLNRQEIIDPIGSLSDLFEEGIKRYCKHSGLIYDGMLAERDLGYKTNFMDEEKKERACAFARMMHDRFSAICAK